MKNKNILFPLLAAGVMGCAASPQYMVITNPVRPKPNEVEFLEHNFKDATARDCYRFVYAGLEEERLQSVLKVEHCFTEGAGDFSWKRYEDTNSDGIVDKVCSQKTTYAGLRQDDGKVDCKDNPTGSKIFSVLREAVGEANYPSVERYYCKEREQDFRLFR